MKPRHVRVKAVTERILYHSYRDIGPFFMKVASERHAIFTSNDGRFAKLQSPRIRSEAMLGSRIEPGILQ